MMCKINYEGSFPTELIFSVFLADAFAFRDNERGKKGSACICAWELMGQKLKSQEIRFLKWRMGAMNLCWVTI